MSDAAWHPDPLGRFELRYWDGTQWTEHVATDGVQGVDPEPIVVDDAGTDTPEDDVAAAAAAAGEAAASASSFGTAAVTPPVDPPAGGVEGADDAPGGAGSAGDAEVDAVDAEAGAGEAVATAEGWDPPAAGTASGPTDEGLPGAAVLGAPVATSPVGGPGDSPEAAAADLDSMPPPTGAVTPAAPAGRDLGADGIGGGLLDDAAYAERSTDRVVLQNPRMLKIRLGRDVMIKRGSMVAYQGQMSFNYESEGGGVTGLLKRAVATDNSKMARVSGSGDLFLADDAFEIHMLELAGGGLVVNGPNLLAFEDGMTFRTRSLGNAGIVAGGVFVTDVSGHGWVAVTCHGTPVRLDTDVPTYVDVGAAVAWSSSLQVDLNVQKLSMKGVRSGEIAQLAFRGQGFVLVQASEGPYVPTAS